MFEHKDIYSELDKNIALGEKLSFLHQSIKLTFPFIVRISATVYDEKTDTIKTFIDSTGGESPLEHYQAKLSDAKSLQDVLRKGRPRVVNDLNIFRQGRHHHTKQIAAFGYRASYTMPMYSHGAFFGFLFFNSFERRPFTEEVLQQIDPYAHLIALTIINDLTFMQTLLATVKTAREMAYVRDDETGMHQDRISRFARLIARKIATKRGLTDEYIEKIFVFSPLHDIGKMGIPDEILLKKGKLTEREFNIMKTHTVKGREFIDRMLKNFNLDNTKNIDILRNIAEFHHESIDGSGYPQGLTDNDIPIEAKIVAVADIFDALTSCRPYKEAWSNEQAFALLARLSGVKLDRECVNAVLESRDEIEHIQKRFQEDFFG